MGLNNDTECCDHCGKPLTRRTRHVLYELPIDVHSANAGESAVLCARCHGAVRSADTLMEEAHRIMEEAGAAYKPDELDADGRPGLGFGPGNKGGDHA
jgi:hypothetical protein